MGRLKEAEEYHLKALKIDPNYEFSNFNLGFIYTNQKRYKEAEASYLKAIESNPKNSNAYNNYGLLLRDDLERYTDAEENFIKAI